MTGYATVSFISVTVREWVKGYMINKAKKD